MHIMMTACAAAYWSPNLFLRYRQFCAKITQILCCRYVAMVTLTVSKIASIYSTDAIFSCQVEKNMTY